MGAGGGPGGVEGYYDCCGRREGGDVGCEGIFGCDFFDGGHGGEESLWFGDVVDGGSVSESGHGMVTVMWSSF